MTYPRVAILISGRGSNMIAILDAAERQDWDCTFALVLSNNSDAKGLDRAAERLDLRVRPPRLEAVDEDRARRVVAVVEDVDERDEEREPERRGGEQLRRELRERRVRGGERARRAGVAARLACTLGRLLR